MWTSSLEPEEGLWTGNLEPEEGYRPTLNLKRLFLQGVEKAAKGVLVGGLACKRLWFGG